jgi:hypothetical protein
MIDRITFHPTADRTSLTWLVSRGDLFLVLLLLCFSGNPALTRQGTIKLLSVGLAACLAIVLNYRRRAVILEDLLVIVFLFGILIAFQSIHFSFFSLPTVIGFFVRLFIGYAIVQWVNDFPNTYVLALYYLAIMSFLFYIPEQIGHAIGFDFGALFQPMVDVIGTSTYRREIFFHTLWQKTSYRNSGMFWEPGAFAGYLNLALLFLGFIKNRLSKGMYWRYLIVLSIALLTTMSTVGYVAYPLVLLLHCDWKKATTREAAKKRFYTILVVIPLFVAICIYGFLELDFMYDKVDHQLESVKNSRTGWHTTRYGSLVFDWEYIKRRPIIGWGFHLKTRYALHPWMTGSHGMGNGMSDFTAKFGVTGMLIFFIALFRGMWSLAGDSVWRSLIAVSIIALALQGETFLNYPLFLGLMFLWRPLHANRGHVKMSSNAFKPRPLGTT